MKKVKLVFGVILVVIGAIIILQNTAAVETHILWYSITMPRAVLLLVTGLVGFALGVIACFKASKSHDS